MLIPMSAGKSQKKHAKLAVEIERARLHLKDLMDKQREEAARLKAIERQRAKEDDVRRQEISGAWVLAVLKTAPPGDALVNTIRACLDGYLKDNEERKLFGLPPRK